MGKSEVSGEINPGPVVKHQYSGPLFQEESGLHSACYMATEYEYVRILCWMIKANRYQEVLEIGTFMGSTTKELLSAVEEIGGNLTTVDPIKKPIGVRSNSLTRMESTSRDFFKETKKTFQFIYIDGAHDFESAYDDLVRSEKALMYGGAMAIHDTSSKGGIVGAKLAVDKFKREFGHQFNWIHFNQGKGLTIAERL